MGAIQALSALDTTSIFPLPLSRWLVTTQPSRANLTDHVSAVSMHTEKENRTQNTDLQSTASTHLRAACD